MKPLLIMLSGCFMKMVKYEKEYDQDKKEAGIFLQHAGILRHLLDNQSLLSFTPCGNRPYPTSHIQPIHRPHSNNHTAKNQSPPKPSFHADQSSHLY